MFGPSPSYPFTPQLKTAWLEAALHDADYIRLRQSVAVLNGFEWGSILPCHLDDTGVIFG